MPDRLACPHDHELEAFLLGRLPNPQLDQLGQHPRSLPGLLFQNVDSAQAADDLTDTIRPGQLGPLRNPNWILSSRF